MNTTVLTLPPGDLVLLTLNARYMRHETFQRLVENVRRHGRLTQLPFVWLVHDDATQLPLDPPRYLVLSGNHRVQAAKVAGLPLVDVQACLDYLAPDERTAIQISHNAIAGEDDPAILKELFKSIQSVDLRLFTGLDDKTLALLDAVDVPSLSEANLNFQSLTVVFLPEELAAVQETFVQAQALLPRVPALYLARRAEYDRLLDAIEQAGAAHGVKNVATLLGIILAIYEAHVPDLQDGWLSPDGLPLHHGPVPLASVLGDTNVPTATAALLQKALSHMVASGLVDDAHRWRLLDVLALAYLDGAAEEAA